MESDRYFCNLITTINFKFISMTHRKTKMMDMFNAIVLKWLFHLIVTVSPVVLHTKDRPP